MPDSKVSKSSFGSNIVFSILSWGVPLLLAFIATPILIRGLGTEQYGYYAFVLAVVGFGFTTGIGRVTSKYIAEMRSDGDDDELTHLLAASLLITFVTALIQGFLLFGLTPFLVSNVLRTPEESIGNLTLAIHIACLIGPTMIVSQYFQSAAHGLHAFRPYSIVTIIGAIALNLGSVLLASNGFSYPSIFWWNLVIAVSSGFVFLVFVRSRLPELKLVRPTAAILRRVSGFALSIFVYQTVTSILFIFERAFVLRTSGAEKLTYYVIPLMLGMYLHGLLASIAQVAIPKLNEKVNDRDQLIAFYKVFTRLVISIPILVSITYIVIGDRLLFLWLGGDFSIRSYSLLVIHGTSFSIIAFSIVCWIMAEAVHKASLNALSSSITMLIAITVIVGLFPGIGLEGVALGRLIGAAAVIPLILFLEKRVFGHILTRFWLTTIVRLITASAIAILPGFVIASITPNNWLTFIAIGLVISIAFLGSLAQLKYLTLSDVSAFDSSEAENWSTSGEPT